MIARPRIVSLAIPALLIATAGGLFALSRPIQTRPTLVSVPAAAAAAPTPQIAAERGPPARPKTQVAAEIPAESPPADAAAALAAKAGTNAAVESKLHPLPVLIYGNVEPQRDVPPGVDDDSQGPMR